MRGGDCFLEVSFCEGEVLENRRDLRNRRRRQKWARTGWLFKGGTLPRPGARDRSVTRDDFFGRSRDSASILENGSVPAGFCGRGDGHTGPTNQAESPGRGSGRTVQNFRPLTLDAPSCRSGLSVPASVCARGDGHAGGSARRRSVTLGRARSGPLGRSNDGGSRGSVGFDRGSIFSFSTVVRGRLARADAPYGLSVPAGFLSREAPFRQNRRSPEHPF